ncbi:MAG: flagellin [Candidatus Solibacter sp.]
MPFSIQTNVNSLIAQENLRVNSNFQSQTIQRLTSGYRINQSGDDAAGLAIANKFRSDTAELMQGVRNANDGISTLQIIDGGMNNIGKMLDRLKTLATQSSSSTFTGDRSVLNKEYQTLVSEIDRQAQGIGLSTGGRFAQSMGVYVGGGTTAAGVADTANGTVTLDLANSAVDTKALGLKTSVFSAEGRVGADIGSGSATSVAAIVGNTSNTNPTTATFNFSGPGFKNVAVTVTLSTASDAKSLVSDLTAAIGTAANAGTSNTNNFRNANIQASLVTDANGAQRLQFTSSSAAFQVDAGTKTANALMGNFKASATVTSEGADVASTVTGAGVVSAAIPGANETVDLLVVGPDGVEHTTTATIATTDTTAALKTTAINNAIKGWGVTAALDGGNKMIFSAGAGQSFQVAIGNDKANYTGLGAWQGNFATKSYTGAAPAGIGASNTSTYQFSVNGGQSITVQVRADSVANAQTDLQAAFDGNATLRAAGLRATLVGGITIDLSSTTDNFRMSLAAGSDLKLSGAAAVAVAGTLVASNAGKSANNVSIEATSTSSTGLDSANDVISFSGMRTTSDSQQVSISTVDDMGVLQATSITLSGNSSPANSATYGGNIDVAITNINAQLQSTGNASLMKIAAVKELNAAGTAEGIRFISSDASFSLKIGSAVNNTVANPVGLYDGTAGAKATQNIIVNSSTSGTLDISSASGALQAGIAIGQAVSKLGTAQAAIGKGQNQLGYAINLANSQISNFSSAQAQIRDADVASEAANLSKAQVLQQASIAAMAQANSAPQAVLSLLKG